MGFGGLEFHHISKHMKGKKDVEPLNAHKCQIIMLCTVYTIMMTSSNGNIFRVTGHLCGEFTGPRWIPRTKASNAEL